ncbi:YheC/YheD family protein [Alicyclobacillus suci]|uniref:YheC/YheD family protein n=1 Tax=Alicyclobacillus suci TaxID=2816080 RepID=UPI001A8BFDDC|nr:YheC/YheD family protein [Alicyclobacillus suci]
MRMSVEISSSLRGNHVRLSGADGTKLPNRLVFGGRATTVQCTRNQGQTKHVTLYVSRALAQALFGLGQNRVLHVRIGDALWRLGPVLGLYVDLIAAKDRPFGEQTRMFEELCTYGQQLGVFVVVQTPGDVTARSAKVYDSVSKTWRTVRGVVPDLVIRRAGTFKKPRAKVAKRELQQLLLRKRLYTLPSQCSNKWTLYQVLHSTPELNRHLPGTTMCTSGTQLYREVMARNDVYVKPPGGSQGVSIYRLQRKGALIEATFERRVVPRYTERLTKVFEPRTTIEHRIIQSIDECVSFWKQTRLTRAVVQDTVELPKLDGQPYDFRWLVQSSDEPTVVARVARVGQKGAVTTNIHTGGDARKAEDLVRRIVGRDSVKETIAKMDKLASQVVRTLAARYGPFAELGIDFALTPKGDIYIFEVNPTPGRRMLRMLSQDTRRLSLEYLLEYAIRATGYGGAIH